MNFPAASLTNIWTCEDLYNTTIPVTIDNAKNIVNAVTEAGRRPLIGCVFQFFSSFAKNCWHFFFPQVGPQNRNTYRTVGLVNLYTPTGHPILWITLIDLIEVKRMIERLDRRAGTQDLGPKWYPFPFVVQYFSNVVHYVGIWICHLGCTHAFTCQYQ